MKIVLLLYNADMKIVRAVEYGFFLGLIVFSGYMVWEVAKPLLSAVALAAIIVTICYPVYLRILKFTPWNNKTVASLFSTLLVLIVVIIPIIVLSSLVVRETISFFRYIDSGGLSIGTTIAGVESKVQTLLPGFQVNLQEQVSGSLKWATERTWAIFAGTVSLIFMLFIALMGTFFFFRDGRQFLDALIKVSPLPKRDSSYIFERLAKAVRAVALGTILISLVQGTLVAIGFSIFGIERAVLWGSVAAVGALMPGVGTSIVTVPGIIFLALTGETVSAIGLLVWWLLFVGMIDNFMAPYLISRGNNLHPFVVLISVIGGVLWLGPVGFVIGPLVFTLFFALLEIYHQYVVLDKGSKV